MSKFASTKLWLCVYSISLAAVLVYFDKVPGELWIALATLLVGGYYGSNVYNTVKGMANNVFGPGNGGSGIPGVNVVVPVGSFTGGTTAPPRSGSASSSDLIGPSEVP